MLHRLDYVIVSSACGSLQCGTGDERLRITDEAVPRVVEIGVGADTNSDLRDIAKRAPGRGAQFDETVAEPLFGARDPL